MTGMTMNDEFDRYQFWNTKDKKWDKKVSKLVKKMRVDPSKEMGGAKVYRGTFGEEKEVVEEFKRLLDNKYFR